MSLCCVFGWWFGCEPVDRASPGGVRKRTTEESVTNWGRLGFECRDLAICIGVLGSTVSGRIVGRDLPGSGARPFVEVPEATAVSLGLGSLPSPDLSRSRTYSETLLSSFHDTAIV